jgi:hypothetical protein
MPAVFGQPTPDENLVPGWNSQSSPAAPGYAQAGIAPAITTVATALQANAGVPQPAGAENVAGENSGSQSVSILMNPGYADGNGTILGQLASALVPVPLTTVAFQNPSGLAAIVTVVGGTVTGVAVAPNVAGVAGTYTTIATGDATVTVPPAGFIKLTYSAAPTWVWVTTN